MQLCLGQTAAISFLSDHLMPLLTWKKKFFLRDVKIIRKANFTNKILIASSTNFIEAAIKSLYKHIILWLNELFSKSHSSLATNYSSKLKMNQFYCHGVFWLFFLLLSVKVIIGKKVNFICKKFFHPFLNVDYTCFHLSYTTYSNKLTLMKVRSDLHHFFMYGFHIFYSTTWQKTCLKTHKGAHRENERWG